jgi:hypothetical protein
MPKTTNNDLRDTTIADIHKIRERISDKFGGDIHSITQDARKRQEQSGRCTVSFAEDAEQNDKSERHLPAD